MCAVLVGLPCQYSTYRDSNKVGIYFEGGEYGSQI